jgi:mRNA interferase RelE/StbE
MKYTVTLSTAAELDLKKLDVGVARRVAKKYLALEDNVRPAGCLPLTDVEPKIWRVRAGDWRVLYTIDDENHRVVVTGIRPRDKAYK